MRNLALALKKTACWFAFICKLPVAFGFVWFPIADAALNLERDPRDFRARLRRNLESWFRVLIDTVA